MKEEEAKCVSLPFCYMENYVKLPAGAKLQCFADFGGSASGLSPLQTVDKKLFSPFGGGE